jgi:hypothetical protein
MSRPAFVIRSPILALAAGLALFAVFSLLRVAILPRLGNASYFGVLLTVAIFALPGVLVGASSPRHSLLYGVLLGALAGAFATLQAGHFSNINWMSRPTLMVFGSFAGTGIILCEIGALAGRALALKRPTANSGIDRPRGS